MQKVPSFVRKIAFTSIQKKKDIWELQDNLSIDTDEGHPTF